MIVEQLSRLINLCFFQVSVPPYLLQYVQLEPTHMDVNDNIKLMQFDTKNYTFSSSGNRSRVQAGMKFMRNIMYHLTNSYLPTISLLILSEMTLFFDKSKKEIAITLSLTVMLVMYTFYQVSISSTFFWAQSFSVIIILCHLIFNWHRSCL
jgi:hypothetical protein